MPQELKRERKRLVKCSWCGKTITSEPISVKTCCVNKPWYFCSEACYKIFTQKWTANQDALKKGKSILRKGSF